MELKEIAAKLDRVGIRDEDKRISSLGELDSNIVIVYPYSDDCIEFRGAIYDELGACDGVVIHLNENGLIQKTCEDEDCPHEKDLFVNTPFQIHQLWCKREGFSWTYETNIPNAEKFIIMETEDDIEYFGEGLVFSMKDLQPK